MENMELYFILGARSGKVDPMRARILGGHGPNIYIYIYIGIVFYFIVRQGREWNHCSLDEHISYHIAEELLACALYNKHMPVEGARNK